MRSSTNSAFGYAYLNCFVFYVFRTNSYVFGCAWECAFSVLCFSVLQYLIMYGYSIFIFKIKVTGKRSFFFQ